MEVIRNIFRFIKGAAALLLGVWILSAAFEASRLVPGNLKDHNFLPEISRFMAEGRFKDAEQLCCYVIGMDLPGSSAAAVRLRQCREESRKFKAKKVLEGFLTGKGESTPALTGAVLSELFFWGDLRDLNDQLKLKLKGQPVDKTVLILSGAGIAADLSGAFFNLPGIFKLLYRNGYFAPAMAEVFRTAFLNVKKMKKVTAGEKELFSNFAQVIKVHGVSGSRTVLRALRTPDELKAAVKVGAKAPEIPCLIALAAPADGGKLLLRFSKSRETMKLLKEAVRKGPRGTAMLRKIRIAKFTAKNIYHGRFRDMMVYEGIRSPQVRGALWCAAVFFGLLCLWFWRSFFFSAGKFLRRRKAGRSTAEDVSRSLPEDSVPDSSSSGCSR